jgi:lactoylglutathione lyase
MQILHTMIRVGNLEKSIEFYTQILGMKILKQKDYPNGRFTLVFVGYQDDYLDINRASIELTYNWDKSDYEIGTGYGHIAIGTDNIYELIEKLRKSGVKITREPNPMKEGTTVLAFI